MAGKTVNVQLDKMAGVHWEAFPEHIVKAVDYVVDIAKKNGSKDYVQTSADWATIREVFNLYAKMYPQHFAEFAKGIREFRKVEYDHGIGGDKGARIQHVLEVPEKFHAMLKAIFPMQKWDRKFTLRLAKECPALKPIDDNY